MTAAVSFGMGLRSEQERVTHSGEASWHLGAEGRMPQGFRGPRKHRPSTELAWGQASVPETITVRADWPHWLLWKRTRCQEHTHFCHWKDRCRSRNLRGWLALGWQRLWPEAEITQRRDDGENADNSEVQRTMQGPADESSLVKTWFMEELKFSRKVREGWDGRKRREGQEREKEKLRK